MFRRLLMMLGNVRRAAFHQDMRTRYTVECFGADGVLKWRDGFDNLVVTEGLNTLLDRSFKNVPANVDWFVMLKGTGSAAAGDVMNSHAGWSEIVAYSQSTRPALTLGSISSGAVSNSASKAVFSINGTATVAGAALTSNSTKSGTTGLLYGAGDFPSSRAVTSGDTLNVQVDLSATAA